MKILEKIAWSSLKYENYLIGFTLGIFCIQTYAAVYMFNSCEKGMFITFLTILILVLINSSYFLKSYSQHHVFKKSLKDLQSLKELYKKAVKLETNGD